MGRRSVRVVQGVQNVVGDFTDNLGTLYVGIVVEEEDDIKGIADDTEMCCGWTDRQGRRT